MVALLLRRFLLEDDGQDLVEYALLVAWVALASLAAVNALQQTMHDVYVGWDSNQQSLWTMPAPGAGGS
jgi:Flp pilus assembly pilin Flp